MKRGRASKAVRSRQSLGTRINLGEDKPITADSLFVAVPVTGGFTRAVPPQRSLSERVKRHQACCLPCCEALVLDIGVPHFFLFLMDDPGFLFRFSSLRYGVFSRLTEFSTGISHRAL